MGLGLLCSCWCWCRVGNIVIYSFIISSVLMLLINVVGMVFIYVVSRLDLNLFSWLEVLMKIVLIVFIWLCMLFGVFSCISVLWIIMFIMLNVFSVNSVVIDSYSVVDSVNISVVMLKLVIEVNIVMFMCCCMVWCVSYSDISSVFIVGVVCSRFRF